MSSNKSQAFIFPGDSLSLDENSPIYTQKVIRFPGSVQTVKDGRVTFTQTGILYHIDSAVKREHLSEIYVEDGHYNPFIHDIVIGRICTDHPLTVDILTPYTAYLAPNGAQNATQASPLKFNVGDVILCRVIKAESYLEVDCRDFQGKTDDAGMGLLEGGSLLKIPIYVARRLLHSDMPTKDLPLFDYAVGANGLLWAKAVDENSQNFLVKSLEKKIKDLSKF